MPEAAELEKALQGAALEFLTRQREHIELLSRRRDTAPATAALQTINNDGADKLTRQQLDALLAYPDALLGAVGNAAATDFRFNVLPHCEKLVPYRAKSLEQAFTEYWREHGPKLRSIMQGSTTPKAFDILTKFINALDSLHVEKGFSGRVHAHLTEYERFEASAERVEEVFTGRAHAVEYLHRVPSLLSVAEKSLADVGMTEEAGKVADAARGFNETVVSSLDYMLANGKRQVG